MTSAALRPIIAQALIGLGLCCGLSLLINAPAQARLANARAELSATRASLPLAASAVPDTPATIESLQLRLAAIEGFNTPARDQTEMYARYMSLAESCGVRIDQLRPAQSVDRAITASPAEIAAGELAKDFSLRCTVVATGPYPALARFLTRVGSDLGHASVRSARLTHVQDAGLDGVQATMEVVHFTFETRLAPRDASPTPGDSVAGAVPGVHP